MAVPRTHCCSLCGAAGWYRTEGPVYCNGQREHHDPIPMVRIYNQVLAGPSPVELVKEIDADTLYEIAVTWRQQANNANNMFTDAERIVWREAAARLAEAIGRPL